MFLGLDCSTQSLSALIIDVEKGTIEHTESVRFHSELPEYNTTHGFVRGTEPDEFFSCPSMWLDALDLLFKKLVENKAPLHLLTGISGAAQQHTTVYLKKKMRVALKNLNAELSLAEQISPYYSRPVSPIWLDSSTENECREIADAGGGNEAISKLSGSNVIQRFSASQIRKYAKQYPERWAETSKIHLVSSFLCSILTGNQCGIDYGDGAGMNLMDLKRLQWDENLASATFTDVIDKLPPLQASENMAGLVSPYFVDKYGVNPKAKSFNWSGDNPCSLVGIGASRTGDWVVSLGTSFTLFRSSKEPLTDPAGFGNVFGNPIKDFMALTCYKNGALACFALKDQLGIEWEEFDELALELPREDEDPVLPFFETEITPVYPAQDQSKTTARTFLDGQFLNMKHHSRYFGEPPEFLYITGGFSASMGVCQTVANIFQIPVRRIENSNSASQGAAMRAAHASGYNLDELEAKFCIHRDTVHPQEGSKAIYEEKMKRFLTLLKTRN